ncbi:flagellin [Clostridium botulinum]|nr:flagellin [Clostridium botulinum]
MIINHNMNAMNVHRQMGMNTVNSGKSMEKLRLGLRINRAGDDAAGLAISEKMIGQIRGLDQASRNSQDAISMIQTAEGGLNETHSILQRMRELGVQAGNDTNTDKDRLEIQKEINQLTSEINRIGNTTEFNNQKLLNATDGTVTAGTTTDVAAKAGKITGSGNPDATSLDGKTLVLKVDGTDKTITFGTSDSDIDKIITKINATATGVATKDADGKLVLSSGTGKDHSIEVTGGTSLGDLKLSVEKATGTDASKITTAAKSSFKSQVGANENQTMTLEFSDMRAAALGITGTGAGFTATNVVTDGTNDTAAESVLDVSNSTNAGNAVTKIQNAINTVSAERSKLGAYQNRLEHTINNLGTSSENLTAAESRIRDVDMAKEMMSFSKNNILSQAAQAMLAQANQQPQGVLQLLR